MKNIVPNEKCLTEVQLLRYLHDECSVAEEKAIDRHLTHCPMCSDALEGAMALNAGRLERSLKHLDAKIAEEYSSKTPLVVEKEPIQTVVEPTMTVVKGGKSRRWLWAAAGVAALATASVFVLTKPVEPSLETASTLSIDTTIQTQSLPQNIDSSTAAIAQTNVSIDNEGVMRDKVATNSPIVATTPSRSTVPNTEGVLKSDEINNSAATKLPQNDADVAVTTQKPSVVTNVQTESEEAKEVTAPLKDVAVADVAKKTRERQTKTQPTAQPSSPYNNYPGAAAQNVQVETAKTKQAVDNGLADYQIGMRAYQKGQFQEAISPLNRVLAKQNKGDAYENALWYLANSYLKLSKKAEAQGILKRIVAEKGKYAPQAQALLK